jgi:hypothetical protein
MSTASDHAHIAFAAGGHTLVRVAVSPRGEIRATDTFICPYVQTKQPCDSFQLTIADENLQK